jgi:hypothetical protein
LIVALAFALGSEFGLLDTLGHLSICVHETILSNTAVTALSTGTTSQRIWFDIHAHNALITFLFFILPGRHVLYFIA